MIFVWESRSSLARPASVPCIICRRLMKTIPEMSQPYLDRAALAAVLGEQLPDAILAKLFPDYALAEVRAVLRGAKKTAGPVAITSSPAQQQSLFAEPVAGSVSTCKLFTDGASRGIREKPGPGVFFSTETAGSLRLGRFISVNAPIMWPSTRP